MLALVAAAAVANAYHHGSVTNLHFTRMSVNGQYTSRTHLNRVAGVDVAIDAIDCTLMVIDEGKMWQCAVPNNAMVRLGAYNVTCDPSNDKYGFYVDSCTIDYELLPQLTKIVERNLTKSVDSSVEINHDFIFNLIIVIFSSCMAIAVVSFCGCIAAILTECDKKIRERVRVTIANKNNPSKSSGTTTTNNTNTAVTSCTHTLLCDLRIKHPERFPNKSLLCESCGQHVALSDIAVKPSDEQEKRSRDRLSASACSGASKRRSHRAHRD